MVTGKNGSSNTESAIVKQSPTVTRSDSKHLQHPSGELLTCLYGYKIATTSLVGSSQTTPGTTAVGSKVLSLPAIDQKKEGVVGMAMSPQFEFLRMVIFDENDYLSSCS